MIQIPSGNLRYSYWTCLFTVSFPSKVVIFHSYVKLLEGMSFVDMGSEWFRCSAHMSAAILPEVTKAQGAPSGQNIPLCTPSCRNNVTMANVIQEPSILIHIHMYIYIYTYIHSYIHTYMHVLPLCISISLCIPAVFHISIYLFTYILKQSW